jgi:hypothetical protein
MGSVGLTYSTAATKKATIAAHAPGVRFFIGKPMQGFWKTKG